VSASTAPLGQPNLAQALATARARGLDRLDAQLLLQHLLHQPRSWVLAHDDTLLLPAQQTEFETLCSRRLAGEPVAYLLGDWGFRGLSLRVSPAVLIPRPDTETLVDWALELLQQPLSTATPQVIDLGTGSGAVAISVARAWPAAQVVATDISEAALAVARDNIARLAPQVTTARGSWWQAVPGKRQFDLAVSNPPYIAGDDPHLMALTHEPQEALTPGADGLDAIRQIVADAPAHLRPGAWLLLEHGWDQAEQVATLMRAAGFALPLTRLDIDGRARCTGARL